MSQGPGSSWRSRVVPGASDHGGQRDHPHQQREQHLGCPGSTAVAVGVGCGICWAGYQIFSWIQFYQKYLRCQQDYKLQTTYLDNLSDTSCCSSKNVRWPVRLVVMGRYCNAPGWIRKKSGSLLRSSSGIKWSINFGKYEAGWSWPLNWGK